MDIPARSVPRLRWRVAAASLVIGAACAHPTGIPRAPNFAAGAWRVRLDVDSAPSRRVPTEPILGTINFATGRYELSLRALSRSDIANAAHVSPAPPAAADTVQRYRITLGDSASIDNRIVMIARAVTADSLIGTWSETILCCSAAGRFTLWRGSAAKPR